MKLKESIPLEITLDEIPISLISQKEQKKNKKIR
jgi:hypothetical protein